MACIAAARGTKLNALPVFNDVIDNNPCGKPSVTSANGVNVTAHSLCLWHLAMKLGLTDVRAPIV